jgi:uncharacterized protein YciI
MILTEDEINNMPVNLGTLWLIKKSHIEALDKIKELDPYYYISKWEYYEDRADQLAVIADALANALEETKAKLQELEDEKRCLEMRLEDCRLEAEGIIAKSHFEANARISELEEILHAFLRAPSTGSDGPGSSTIVIQEYHLRDARAALKATKKE